MVDLGAQWIHGESGNVVYNLASKYDILGSFDVINDPNKHTFATVNGEIIPKEESREILMMYFNIMEDAQKELKEERGSLGDYVARK